MWIVLIDDLQLLLFFIVLGKGGSVAFLPENELTRSEGRKEWGEGIRLMTMGIYTCPPIWHGCTKQNSDARADQFLRESKKNNNNNNNNLIRDISIEWERGIIKNEIICYSSKGARSTLFLLREGLFSFEVSISAFQCTSSGPKVSIWDLIMDTQLQKPHIVERERELWMGKLRNHPIDEKVKIW